MRVMGWTNVATDENGIEYIVAGEVSAIELARPEFTTAVPETTTSAQLSGNINTNDGVDGITTQIKMYDTLGNLYYTNFNLNFDEATSTWSLSPVLYDVGTQTGLMRLTDTAGNEYYVANAFRGIGAVTDAVVDAVTLQFNEKGEIGRAHV